MTSDGLPRLLLVEDDPTSRVFLTAALQAVPADVDAVDSVAAAVALAASQDYALWLIDANLPDGSGRELLARLHERHPRTPALAHTAASDATVLDGLIAAGFVEVLVKPLPAAGVQSAVRRLLRLPSAAAQAPAMPAPGGKLPVWDDAAAALALNGNRAHVDALRGLFAQELPKSLQSIRDAAARRDDEAMRADLHRLRASCGFVGAARLGAAVQALQQEPASPAWLSAFEQALQDTLAQPARTQSPPA